MTNPQTTITLEVSGPFDLRLLVRGHGWVKLEPFHWDDEAGRLSHSVILSSGAVYRWSVEQVAPTRLTLQIQNVRPSLNTDPSALASTDCGELIASVKWALRLDESFAGFYELCSRYSPLAAAASTGAGRLLRSPTVWEDAAKTLCTTCTTWSRTRTMVAGLIRGWGESEHFPTPLSIASAPEEDLRRFAGLGYRARSLKKLAQSISVGNLELESLKSDQRPTVEIRQDLLALPGIGPYAAANLLMLLGRYDHIALDSWVRRVVEKGWLGGRSANDREIIAAFEPFGEWKALVYWFWDWNAAAEEWTWREG